MISTRNAGESPLVVVGTGTGVSLIPSPTQLTRLNYFDGKFLRAEDLSAEQNYLRSLVQLSNQAGGAGVVHGFDTRLGAGGALELGPGLAIDRAGRVLLLPHPTSVGVAELIERSRNPAAAAGTAGKKGSAGFAGCLEPAAGQPPATSVLPAELYLVVLGHAEALCGEEDVYGKLCEDACSPDTNRRFRVEGVVLRAVPVSLDPPTTPFPTGTRRHLRSLAASAYFGTERARLGREMSGTRLRADPWCHPAPVEHWPVEAGEGVPLALLSVTGGVAEWLDAWTARRERMEAPPRKAWAWQMMMRPWEVFLAQVLQFQCQLHDVLTGTPPDGGPDPCEDRRRLLERARAVLDRIERRYQAAPAETARPTAAPRRRAAAAETVRDVRPEYLPELAELQREILVALDEGAPGSARVLVDGGIVELPPAGYLPVVPGREVDEQVRQLLGEGVDLRFCAVRPDYVAHALEEAQHLDRIGLLQGLENPAARPEVDVLVPDGEPVVKQVAPPGCLFEVVVRSALRNATRAPQTGEGRTPGAAAGEAEGEEGEEEQPRTLLRGAGQGQRLPGGGGAFHFAGVSGQLDGVSLPGTGEPDGPGEPTLTEGSGKRSSGTEDTERAAGIRMPRVPAVDEALGAALGWMFRGAARTRAAAAAPADTAPAGAAAGRQARAVRRPGARALDARGRVTLGVWATLRCEGDPFALDVGDSAPVRAEGLLAVDGLVVSGRAVSASIEVRVVADLVCRVPAEGGSRMVGRLQGWAFRDSTTRVDGEEEDGGEGEDDGGEPLRVDLRVELELRPAAGGSTVLEATAYVDTGDGVAAVTLTTSWRGAPVLARSVAALDLLRTARERLRTATGEEREELLEVIRRMEAGETRSLFPVLQADARENPGVADAANPFHADAVRALKAIARVRDDAGFREASERLLFPPPPKRSGEARVRAVRDWVLFHRRRRSSCDCCPGAAVAAPPRRYRVYHIVLTDDPSPEEIREALASPEGPREELQLLGIVPEFEGGTATLLTARGALLDAWRDAAPGGTLYYGAIAGAGEGAGDPDALLDGRLDRIASVVASVTPELPGAVFDVLGRPPSWLAAGGADGVVVLLTYRPEVATECLRVYGLPDQGMMSFILSDRIPRGQLQAELPGYRALGTVSFQPGSATPVGTSLQDVVDAWNADGFLGDLQVARAVVVVPNGDDPAATAEARTDAVAAALGGRLTDGHARSNEPLFGECGGIVLLEPGQRQAPVEPRVALFVTHFGGAAGSTRASPSTDPQMEFRFSPDGAIQDEAQFRAAVDRLKAVAGARTFQGVRLATVEGATPPLSTASLEAVYKRLRTEGLLGIDPAAAKELTSPTPQEREVATRAVAAWQDVVLLEFTIVIN